MRALVSGLVIACFVVTSASAQRETCGLTWLVNHEAEGGVDIWASASGMPAIYYHADLDVNTDGSPISYHPDDAYGKGPAINNIVNAMYSATDSEGKSISCGKKRGPCFERWVAAFTGAKAIDFNPKKFPRVSFKDMIPSKIDPELGWAVPCKNSGPYEGYYISQTSAIMNSRLGVCKQGRYLDALAVNANVLPKHTSWASQGIVTDGFDLVVVRDASTGQVAFAVNGDRGPYENIGEGSVRLAAQLSGTDVASIKNYDDAKHLKRPDVQYLIFPNIDLKKLKGSAFSQKDVNDVGLEAFSKWGGAEKLATCK